MGQLKVKRTGDADYPRYMKILLQGPPKSGKTTFLSTLPNIVIAAVEAGLMSIAHLDVPYSEIESTDDLQTLYLMLKDPSMRQKLASQLSLPQIESVAIDTVDAWQDMLKKEILKENRRSQMQQADWGTLKERMATILKAYASLPLNVVFTVHTSTTQDDESRLIYMPSLQGAIKDEIAGFVDFSLLAFRQRDVDAEGKAKINYYLKNEGDLKNPALGNRAAGRLPEISQPSFKILHDAVFRGIDQSRPSNNPTEITVDQSTPMAPPQRTAGVEVANLSEPETTQPAQTPSTPVAPAQSASPSGVPQDDDEKPVNAVGLQVLTKHYLANSLILPSDVKEWTLGKARLISRWFVAVKQDAAAGKVVPRNEIIDYLKAYDAYAGDLPGVQTGVENVAPAPKSADSEVASPVTEADAPTTSGEAHPASTDAAAAPPLSTDDTEAAAIALVKEELGAVEIGRDIKAGTKCAVCDEDVDDLDVANLAVTRFNKPLCVKDYKAESKAKQTVSV